MSNNGHFLLQEMKNTHCNINCSRCSTWKDLTGLSWFNWQTWICLSVEQEAKLSSDFLGRWNWTRKKEKNYQSTSRAGAEWNANCCLQLPVAASQIIVVLTTRRRLLILFPRLLSSWWKWWKLDLLLRQTCQLLRSEWNFLSCSTSRQRWDPVREEFHWHYNGVWNIFRM